MSTDPAATDKQHGRASKLEFIEEEVSFGNDMTHFYATPACSFWEQLGATIRLLKGYLKNGTTDHVMDLVCSTLATMTEEIHQWRPAPCELQKPSKLKLLIEKLMLMELFS